MRRRNAIVTAVAVAGLLVAAACTRSVDQPVEGPSGLGTLPGGGSLVFNPAGRGVGVVGGSTVPTIPPKPNPVVVVGGNVACAPDGDQPITTAPQPDRCQDMATLQAMLPADPDAVLALGDLQEDRGALDAFRNLYDPSWGTLRSRTRAVPGVAEYRTAGASGYFDYFGGSGGEYGKGWYSFDLGKWHIVALNSNCEAVGGCGPDSDQGRWLADDLRTHASARCTLAVMNRPRFSSAAAGGDDPSVAPLWEALSRGGADVVLAAHHRHYERLAPLGPDGSPDPMGMASFVIGTGGQSLVPPGPARPGSEARTAEAFGVVALTLLDGALEYAFLPVAGATYGDSGRLACS